MGESRLTQELTTLDAMVTEKDDDHDSDDPLVELEGSLVKAVEAVKQITSLPPAVAGGAEQQSAMQMQTAPGSDAGSGAGDEGGNARTGNEG